VSATLGGAWRDGAGHPQDAHIGAPQNEFGSLLATLVGRPS
jgi:hypothetical protein